MFKIKATFTSPYKNSALFYGGCGIAKEKYAFKYPELADLPFEISWGFCEAKLSDIDPRNGSLGVYKTNGKIVAEVVA